MQQSIAKAYVQIVPTADGITGKLSEALGAETESAGQAAGLSLGSTIGSFIKKAIIALGIGDIIRQAITEGADLQQSLGGIETLFKENADMVVQYAQEAYKTAGLSANDYMENVTSFSASLLQGLGGDTKQAAEIANMAMIDMSDNANKMGTDMVSIQNAYQGFAKQNYTMLDNLKLGYGGTKTEMERLLADAQALTGVEYDISNLADVYQAIHVIQEDLDITGTTALEASETISGSFASVKAAWSNLLADMTLGNDVSADIEALGETVLAAASNILPAIANLIGSAPTVIIDVLNTLGPPLIEAGMEMVANLATGLGESLPVLVDNFLNVILTMVNAIIDNIDIIISAGLYLVLGLVTGILNAVPNLIKAVPVIISSLLTTLLAAIPQVIEAGLNIFTSLVTNLPEIISNIVGIIPTLIDAIIGAVVELIPLIINTGVELLSALVTNLPAIISAILEVVPIIIVSLLDAISKLAPTLVVAGFDLFTGLVKLLPEMIVAIVGSVIAIIDAIVNTVVTLGEQFPTIGKNLVDGLWNGIKSGWSSLVSNVNGMANSLVTSIKSTLGIHSPSTVFRDEIGKMLDLGLAEGIEGNANAVTDAMSELSHLATDAMETDVVMNAMVDSKWSTYDQGTVSLNGISSVGNEQIYNTLTQVLNLLDTYMPGLANQKITLDSGAVVGAIAPKMDQALGMLSVKNARGVVV